MDSKIIIDIDHEGRPYISIDYRPTEDLRDKVLGRFLTATGTYLRREGMPGIPLNLHLLDWDKNSGRTQAMIEPVEERPVKQLHSNYLIVLSVGNVVQKEKLSEDDWADANEGHSSIIDLEKGQVYFKNISLSLLEG